MLSCHRVDKEGGCARHTITGKKKKKKIRSSRLRGATSRINRKLISGCPLPNRERGEQKERPVLCERIALWISDIELNVLTYPLTCKSVTIEPERSLLFE